MPVTDPVEEDTVVEENDPEYRPEEVLVSDEVHDISIQSGDNITAVLDTSPIRYRLKSKPCRFEYKTTTYLEI